VGSRQTEQATPEAQRVSLLLDAGAFLAVERGDRHVIALIKRERLAGRAPRTHGGVIGQVWRGGARQARIAALIKAVEIESLDVELGRQAGVLLGRTKSDDVIDAALVLLGRDRDEVLTSDPEDLLALASSAGVQLELVRV
jgi:hypothetical protein